MQSTHVGPYGYPREVATHHAGEVETWIANSIATILAFLGILAGVFGLFEAFGYFNSGVNNFDNGMVWMVGGVILVIAANVFRREHHVTDASELVETLEASRMEPPGNPGRAIRE